MKAEKTLIESFYADDPVGAYDAAIEAAATFAEELVAQLCPANDHHSPREIADRIRGKLLRAP